MNSEGALVKGEGEWSMVKLNCEGELTESWVQTMLYQKKTTRLSAYLRLLRRLMSSKEKNSNDL